MPARAVRSVHIPRATANGPGGTANDSDRPPRPTRRTRSTANRGDRSVAAVPSTANACKNDRKRQSIFGNTMSDRSEPDHASAWGRVADDGTVFVRTASGERAVGSWRAGSLREGLAHFERRFDDLSAEVELLERRLTVSGVDPAGIVGSARRLLDSLDEAAVVGDLDALRTRLEAVVAATEEHRSALAAERAERAGRIAAAKEQLVAEAERLGRSSEWKTAGERFRALAEEFRAAGSLDKRTDSALWRRIATARDEFTRRRTAHFAALDTQRARSRERKEAIIAEAEALSDSTDWAGTAARYRALLADWKAAGRAAKDIDDALWNRFRAAQDAFFTRRNEANAERDAELRENQVKKEKLLAEATALDPADTDRSLRRLREIQDRWDEIGRVPREVAGSLERQMAAIGDKLREASDARWAQRSLASSPFVTKL
ncbi:DNA repair ATPase, partial [Frankia casuarinae]